MNDTDTTLNTPSLPSCTRCQGSLVLDQERDLISGITLPVFLCINCGARRPVSKDPTPLYKN